MLVPRTGSRSQGEVLGGLQNPASNTNSAWHHLDPAPSLSLPSRPCLNTQLCSLAFEILTKNLKWVLTTLWQPSLICFLSHILTHLFSVCLRQLAFTTHFTGKQEQSGRNTSIIPSVCRGSPWTRLVLHMGQDSTRSCPSEEPHS